MPCSSCSSRLGTKFPKGCRRWPRRVMTVCGCRLRPRATAASYSTGYDAFDPFDLGSTNQQGTIATFYGTQSDLIRMVQTAHRFGIRVYFDNVMNHRASTVPGYPGSGTPTNYYPGLHAAGFSPASRFGRVCELAGDWSQQPKSAVVHHLGRGKPAAASACAIWPRTGVDQFEFWSESRRHDSQTGVCPVPGPSGFIYGHQRPLAGNQLGPAGLAPV